MNRSRALSSLLCTASLAAAASAGAEKPNVLFIIVDDLRPELGCYGNELINTPNIDRLAESGTIFTQAYCNVPVCGASRASLLTGIRPGWKRFVGYNTWAEKDAPDAVPLTEHFRGQGYTTRAHVGKFFHHRGDFDESWDNITTARGKGSWKNYLLPENLDLDRARGKKPPPWEIADVPDNAYKDGIIAENAVAELEKLAGENRPFFMGVGFLKPHLPFNAPKKYWDMYPPEKIKLPENYYWPKSIPDHAHNHHGELRSGYYVGKSGKNDVFSEEFACRMIRGYYAATSYVDVQVGKVLDALDRTGLAENTIVILIGDHGWNLGEHTLWCKHANFKVDLNTPLIIRAPGHTPGTKAEAQVEFIDIYPTLCELAGLSPPGGKNPQLQGKSMAPLLKNPKAAHRQFVICKYKEGVSIKKGKWLYTEWLGGKGRGIEARMLFDHSSDPLEVKNLAEDPEYSEQVRELQKLLHDNWGADFWEMPRK